MTGGEARDAELRRGTTPSVVILGSGPNRIGQGIEFDYCCVHAAMTVRETGRDAVMINCNPETVSTDYDTSTRLYFEPLTVEDVLEVVDVEQPEGVIVQFGGQTPLRIAAGLQEAGVRLLGTPVEAIDLAEDRGRFGTLLDELGIQVLHGVAHDPDEALAVAAGSASCCSCDRRTCWAGARWRSRYVPEDLERYLERLGAGGGGPHVPAAAGPLPRERDRARRRRPRDGKDVYVAGIMQHVEEAGVHSGDSACVLPPLSLGEDMLEEVRRQTAELALRLGVIGLVNVQFGLVDNDRLHVIEANPRASRTVPFVSKAIGVPLAKVACRVILGERLPPRSCRASRAGAT